MRNGYLFIYHLGISEIFGYVNSTEACIALVLGFLDIFREGYTEPAFVELQEWHYILEYLNVPMQDGTG